MTCMVRTVAETCVINQLISRMTSEGALMACPAGIISSGDLSFRVGAANRVSLSSVLAKHVYSKWMQGVHKYSLLASLIRNGGTEGPHYEKTYDNFRRRR